MNHIKQNKIVWCFLALSIIIVVLVIGIKYLSNSKVIESNVLSDKKVTLNIQIRKEDAPAFFDLAGVKIEGYHVKYVSLSSALTQSTLNLIARGEVDLAWMSEIPPVFAASHQDSNHQKFKVLASRQGGVNNQVILIPKGSDIRTVSDLKGKRIAYVRATTTHYFLAKILKEHGLGFADIYPMALTVEDAFAAFKRGDVDAWVTWGLHSLRAQSDLDAKVFSDAEGYLSGNYLIVTGEHVLKDPAKYQAVQDYIAQIEKIWLWSQQHPDLWAEHLSTLTNIPEYWFGEKTYSWPWHIVVADTEAIQSQQQVADFLYQQRLISKPVQVASLWKTDFVIKELPRHLN